MSHTLRQRLKAGIEARGGSEAPTQPLKRHLIMVHPRDPERRFFVGVTGALRVGGQITSSMSLTGGLTYQNLLKEGDARLADLAYMTSRGKVA